MKKKDIINLIKYHCENNDFAFKEEAIKIANYFDASGDYQLASYIISLISEVDSFVPQNYSINYKFLKKVEPSNEPLPLPRVISNDIIGIINASNKNLGLNKFLFYGEPGTGKTETAKHISRILGRDLFVVNFECVVDSKLGQTMKNIVDLFAEINGLVVPSKAIILFDEIDSLVLDRINNNDVREMGRATSTFLKALDELNSSVVLIATTNMFNKMDKALLRRFDATIDFGRYSREELVEIARIILDSLMEKIDDIVRDNKLFAKIINSFEKIPYPAELANIIKTAVAFSNPNDPTDYLKRLATEALDGELTIVKLVEKNFTYREISILLNTSKSEVHRRNKGVI